jgi:hypothetical protein
MPGRQVAIDITGVSRKYVNKLFHKVLLLGILGIVNGAGGIDTKNKVNFSFACVGSL